MSEAHSVSELVDQLKLGHSTAAKQIWDRFINRLVALSRRKLANYQGRIADEEDVALEAFDAFLRGVAENRFERLENGDDLWQILAMLTERKAIALLRSELANKRGGGQVRGESAFGKTIGDSESAIGIVAIADPSPEVIDGFTQTSRDCLDALTDETMRNIARLRLEGYTNREIGQRLNIALRTVERKIRLIRKKWEQVTY